MFFFFSFFFSGPSAEREAEVLYEVLFDEEFAGGLTIRYRGYCTEWTIQI